MRPGRQAEHEAYTLDTSAFLALWNDEAGAGVVEKILRRAEKGDVRVNCSFITLMEIYYGVMRKSGKAAAEGMHASLGFLPVQKVWPDERLLIEAAEIKSGNQLSVADAWIAATAFVSGSTLVHKDPEFSPLEGRIRQVKLWTS